MRPVIGLVLLTGVSVASIQQPFSTPPFQEADANEYQFDWPIQRAAIIGAGPRYLVSLTSSSLTNTSL